MSKERRIFNYSFEKTDQNMEISQAEILADLKKIQGLIDISVDFEEFKIDYEIDEWASEYDVFSAVSDILESHGLDIKFDNAEEKVAIEENSDENIEEDKKEEKKQNTKADFAEKIIVLSVAVVLSIVGAFLKPNAAMWLFMIAYAFAAYETLFGVITAIVEKKYLLEELLILVSTLILLYVGKRVEACVIMICYAAVSLLVFIFKNSATKRIDELNTLSGSEQFTEKDKRELELYDKLFSENQSDEVFILNNRLKFHIILVVLAVLVTFIPPIFGKGSYGTLLTGKWLPVGAWIMALGMISPLLKSIKAVYYFGINKLFKNGVVPNSCEALKSFSDVKEAVFDKTGVLNLGKAEIVECLSEREDFTKILVSALSNSTHPIALAVKDKYGEDGVSVKDFNEIENRGVVCELKGKKYLLGNKKLLAENGVEVKEYKGENSPLYVAEGGEQIGVLTVKYVITGNAYGAVTELNEDTGIKTTLISSDSVETVNFYKNELGLNKAIAAASTDYKTSYLGKEKRVYIGNADYDGKVLSEVKNSVSLGKINESSAFSIVNSDVKELPPLLKICKRTGKILKLNFKFAFVVKVLSLIVGVALFAAFNVNVLIWLFAFDFLVQTFTMLYSLTNRADPV